MPLTAGTRLGEYEIRELIGKGGMGEVYLAYDTNLKRDVAMKVLPEAFARDSERVARFRREATLLASLNHPNIASIYRLEESGPSPALVMEYVPGETLADRIRRSGAVPLPVPIDEALEITKQIADALEHAHEGPVIHRDLNPPTSSSPAKARSRCSTSAWRRRLLETARRAVRVSRSSTRTRPP
ncbi:MAG: serine/threonine protein kinase [Acidobacteria bacterium]|nr:serine/threonine protein kinase [Acidobacteriota bacterium]